MVGVLLDNYDDGYESAYTSTTYSHVTYPCLKTNSKLFEPLPLAQLLQSHQA